MTMTNQPTVFGARPTRAIRRWAGVVTTLVALSSSGCFEAADRCEQLVRCAQEIDGFDGQSSAPGFREAVSRNGHCYQDSTIRPACDDACDAQIRRMKMYADVMGYAVLECTSVDAETEANAGASDAERPGSNSLEDPPGRG